MVNLLSEIMVKYAEQISQLNYDLSQNEVLRMAAISRDACNYYDNGGFLLIIYLV